MATATKEFSVPASSDSGESPEDRELYRHVKRPQWGVAILAWEKEETRGYQFEDGRLRKIKKGYYDLLQTVDDIERSKDAIVQNLENAVAANRGQASPKRQEKVAPFEEQIELFTEMYPKGFNDPQWIADHRRDPDGRALKRHREPVVEDTKEALSAERCATLLEEEKYDELVETTLDILAGTSLVPISHVKTLRQIDEEERKHLAEAVNHLLHGEPHFDVRFGEWLEVLTKLFGGRPSWRTATALPALAFPKEQVNVRRSAFIRQAGSIAPTARYSKKAKVRSYKNYRRMAVAVRKRLEQAGHEPRDLLDVHDFIWATLRNSALDQLGDDDD